MFLLEMYLFWPLIWLAIVVGCIIASESEATVSGVLLLFAGIGFTSWLNHVNPFVWVINNLPIVMVGVLIYFAIGVCWSFFKWDRFCGHSLFLAGHYLIC